MAVCTAICTSFDQTKEGTLWTLAVVPAALSEVAETGCP